MLMPAHPSCMTDAEYEAWLQANAATPEHVQAADPCLDCTDAFAAAMIEARLCDGPMRSFDEVVLRRYRYAAQDRDRRLAGATR